MTVKPTACIRVEYYKNDYIPGKGACGDWEEFHYTIQKIEHNKIPVEWVNVHGSEVFTAQTLNLKELATIRMGFNPQLYTILNTCNVRIYLNNETDKKKAFTVYGPCDNIRMENKMLEFKVQRLEVK